MLAYKLLASGLSDLTVQALCLDVAGSLTAAGTIQSDAYAITTAKAYFSTVASGTGALLPSDAAIGDSVLVYNGGVNLLKVYPPSGCQFNGNSLNAPHLLAVNTACEFHKLTATLWTGILSL